MPVSWRSEACDQGYDPESGAFVVRLTQAARHSINIYQEQPYTSPDGRRIAIMRSAEADPRFSTHDLYVADLKTYRIQPADHDCQNYFAATSAWSGIIHYLSADMELCRFDITTMEKQIVWTHWPFPREFMLESASPDQRFIIGTVPQSNYKTALIRVDLVEKTWKTIIEREDLFAAHLQYRSKPYGDGRPGADIVGMVHRGKSLNHHWDMKTVAHPNPGTGYYVIDNDGGGYRELPAGPPHTGETGHSAWVGDTGRVAFAAAWDTSGKTWKHDPRWPEGNLFTAAPGDAKPKCFRAPEHFFNHVSVSRCGRYFICDSYPKGVPGPVAIVVGNLETGKYRNLLGDCKASSGGPACSHAHPYMTADNKHVIYNADPFQIGQVHKALLAEGFLASLD
jgi:hypothetical protein